MNRRIYLYDRSTIKGLTCYHFEWFAIIAGMFFYLASVISSVYNVQSD